ncbi:Bifunctional inhibitor/lipid-transfer protein/seed storage 2S albumin superfamily protein [Thalictrum thalictroides]|uniref:Bifunctional inhibitor/lipid-transfer protein/seed storage 2S albumin superfamily protein n=1 Tax=Thalictrum thalictroides TaxID=46969 RepID=A0A7J6UZD3_THATH|nr:Bifunctional inhibitor/lipid-transfer protein/seed storage 2S albumin superfamily protein [Thalictrum thalictroides]
MASILKTFYTAITIFLLVSFAHVRGTKAAGECGRTPINNAALSLSPCLAATGSVSANVPPLCCSKVAALLKTSPKCLCAVFLSPLVKKAGIKPEIAITIPKRCNIRNRPAGKKCGRK